jgi:hypothetical protein
LRRLALPRQPAQLPSALEPSDDLWVDLPACLALFVLAAPLLAIYVTARSLSGFVGFCIWLWETPNPTINMNTPLRPSMNRPSTQPNGAIRFTGLGRGGTQPLSRHQARDGGGNKTGRYDSGRPALFGLRLLLVSAFLIASLLCGCARMSQSVRTITTDPTTGIVEERTSKATGLAFWDAKNTLDKLRVSNGKTTQAIGLTSTEQQAYSTNIVAALELLLKLMQTVK